jgi:hypothetical protein
LPESKKQRELKKQRKPKKPGKPKYLWEPGAHEMLSKSAMQWKPEILRVPGMSCESWVLPESKKQGKPKYLWEPWKRSKPGEPGKLSGVVQQEQENRTLSRPSQPRFSQ